MMKRQWAALVLCGWVLGCAGSTAPTQTLTDRYGVMTITPPPGFSDRTSDYLAKLAKYETMRGGPPRSRFRSLLSVRSQKPDVQCIFRELRYRPNEVGYAYPPDELARLVAAHVAKTLLSFDEDAHADRNGSGPMLMGRIERVEPVSSGAVTLGAYPGWQVVWRAYPTSRIGDPFQPVDLLTAVITIPKAEPVDTAKRFLFGTCSIKGRNDWERTESAEEVDRMLQSIRLTYVPDGA